MPIDANNINFEQAIVRLLVLLHTNGKQITRTGRDVLYPDNLVDILKDNTKYFEGISDTVRERLMKNWISSDFATTVNEGKGRHGEPRISNLKPLHLSTIKLLDPRIRSQDRDVSVFLYNVFKGDGSSSAKNLLMDFLIEGTKKEGSFNLVTDEDNFHRLDIETQFLLRILDSFRVDNPSTREKDVPSFKSMCEAHQRQFFYDVIILLVYRNSVPRRELLHYLTVLLNFHCALFVMKTFTQVNAIVETHKTKCSSCKSIASSSEFNKLCKCDFQPKMFVDLTLGQDKICDSLSKRSVDMNYSEMFRYIKTHYKLVKLAEFAATKGQKDLGPEQLIGFLNHPDLNGHFSYELSRIIGDPDMEGNENLQEILKMDIPPLDKFIEILCNDPANWKFRTRNHKSMMTSLCNMNRDDGFLQGGRGKKRKYVLGNVLLEVLVQLAVVSADPSKGFNTQPITIASFVEWLKNRYGLYINSWPSGSDSPETAKALTNNYNALKDRLRQLGFYTDLSDASNSQVIKPRFKVEPA